MRWCLVWLALGLSGPLLACSSDGDGGGAERDIPLVYLEGFEHRLVVKFSDTQAARASGGAVELGDAAATARLAEIAGAHRMRFSPLIALDERILDILSDVARSDFGAVMQVELPASDRDTLLDAAAELRSLSFVEYVYLEQLGLPPPGDIDPVSDDFSGQQNYRAALGADAAQSLGATGAGIKLFDCEYGWDLEHEDLMDIGATLEEGQTIPQFVYDNDWDDHGTGVIGITSAPHNGYGVNGIVPDAALFLHPENSNEEGGRRATAIATAIAAASPGDVILLEMQAGGPGGGYGPAEIDPAVWDLVFAASAVGITIVAAAGNGSQDLDSDDYEEYRSRGDSGAIIVGAGSDGGLDRLGFSTFGERVNVHGWGQNVVTTGYGDLAEFGGDEHQSYSGQFSGTSSASPMVAAAAVAIQSHAVATTGKVLTTPQLRQLMIDTGTPQSGGGGNIGPLPNLAAALEEVGAMAPEPCGFWADFWCQLTNCSYCGEQVESDCGNRTCDEGETEDSCPQDCAEAGCGNGVCDDNETADSCGQDCGCAAPDACGTVAPEGCWCDSMCTANGDCCPDVGVCQ